MMKNAHEIYIKRCFELAKKGLGYSSPNPLVGSVIVKNNKIIGEGYHKRYGQHHAEVNAIKSANESVAGSTLYVNLEPCCHTNKQTPPCTKLILNSGIKKVVVSNLDPNPEVSGKGLKILRDSGIEVEFGVLANEGALLNEIFFYYILNNKPFIHLKLAQTIDGRICDSYMKSKWITNESAREEVHLLRQRYDAISVGRKTIEVDDPSLDVRLEDRVPLNPKIILFLNPDNLDFNYKVFNNSNEVLIFTPTDYSKKISKNIECINLNTSKYNDDFFNQAFNILGDKKISSLLIEGGSTLASTIIKENLFNKLTVYISPKFLGNGVSSYTDTKSILDCSVYENVKVRELDGQAVFDIWN